MTGCLAIINTSSGTYASSRFRERWLPQLEKLVDTLHFTARRCEGTRLAAAAGRYSGLVVVGGDGSIADVIAGMDLARQWLAVVPTGRGNTLARELGFANVAGALAALGDGGETHIDLMQARCVFCDGEEQRRLAVTTIGAGYTADVVRRAARLRRLGRLAYATAATLTRPRSMTLKLRTDDGPARDLELTGLIVNNTRYLANFLALRTASPADGRLDVMLLDAGWLGQLAHNVSVLAGSEAWQPARLCQSRQIDARFATAGSVMLDGDLVDHVSELCVSTLPRALRVRCAHAS